MAAAGLKNFKEIIENKAYRVNPNDRKLFEQGDMQSFFGLSEDDFIEFIMYDAFENQVPQRGFGLVRYIPLTTSNINDYFLIAEGTVMTVNNLPKEFFVDVERLIREAGYANGIFKTQISLLNKRFGSYKENDKAWIGEISPSRTEVRLFPMLNSPNVDDLKSRFDIFYTNGSFKSDVIYNVFRMIEATTPSIIIDTIKKSYGESFYNKLKSEYNIQNFDVFAANIHKKFIESAQYEFTNRISNIKDPNYGKPKTTKPPLQLSEDTIMKLLEILIVNAITFYLPPKSEQLEPLANRATDSSMDDAAKILQTKASDIKIDTKAPEQKVTYKENPNVSDKSLEYKRKLQKELPVDLGPVNPNLPTPVDDGPIIRVPVEKENPTTGEIITYDDVVVRPFKPADEKPIIIETPIGGGGGGGGTRGGTVAERDFGTGFGREQTFTEFDRPDNQK